MARAMSATPRAQRPRTPLLLVLLVTSVALIGCSEDRAAQYAAHVTAADDLEGGRQGDWTPLAQGEQVPIGTDLRTGTQPARLELSGGRLWLASGTAVTLHSDHIELLQGEALLEADEPLAIHRGSTRAYGTGVFRMRLGATPRVGVYRGQVTVRRPAERTTVPALRQVGLAGRRLHTPDPLSYRSADPWDSIWMDEALQMDAEAARLAGGIERSYGAGPQPHEFYTQFAPQAEPAIALLARTARERVDSTFGPPADTLLTLFVAQATGGASLVNAVRDVLALRAEGARWGLIGVELEVSTQRLAAVVDLGHAQQVAAVDAAAPAPAREPAPPRADEAVTPAPAPQPATGPSEPSPAPGPTEPEEPEDPAAQQPLGPVSDPLEELLEQTLGPLSGGRVID